MLSGDHIVEQHVHNLDVMNWVLGSHPLRAVSGLGGRQVRTNEEHGYIFDHFAVEFEYPNEVSMFSQCRQIDGCRNIVEEAVVGTHGTSNCKDRIQTNDGQRWRFRERSPSAYKLEHEHLIASIRAGSPINEAQSLAESTLTGIMGREAVYSGQTIEWDEALQSTVRLGPERYEFWPVPHSESRDARALSFWLSSSLDLQPLCFFPVASSTGERIEHFYLCVFVVPRVAGCDGQVMLSRCGGNEAVFDWHSAALPFQLGQQGRPFTSCVGIHIHDTQMNDSVLKPLTQSSTAFAGGQQPDSIFQLAQDDWIQQQSYCWHVKGVVA